MEKSPFPRQSTGRFARLLALSWREQLIVSLPVLVVLAVTAWAAVKFVRLAPPATVRMLGGIEGSTYRRQAERYKAFLERNGVKVEIVASKGSLDNLKQLADENVKVDVGFVQGGTTDGVDITNLVSLGSVFEQPLFVYYRQEDGKRIGLVSELRGKRIAVGPEGSGTRVMARKVLDENGIGQDDADLRELAGDEAVAQLKQGAIDAAFLMGDSVTAGVMRTLRETPGIDLMSFHQADAYVRVLTTCPRIREPVAKGQKAKNAAKVADATKEKRGKASDSKGKEKRENAPEPTPSAAPSPVAAPAAPAAAAVPAAAVPPPAAATAGATPAKPRCDSTQTRHFLKKLVLPEGGLDLARNFPDEPVQLIGPTVELIARRDLHPALSDLLITAAKQVHGGAGMYREAGEFPKPLLHEFAISEDAERFYKSGQKFLYKRLPFWLASLFDRLWMLLLPILVALLPAMRIAPAIYRWRVRSRVYRWYGVLMALEREMLAGPDEERRQSILQRLDDIQRAVSQLRLPLAFADQLYVLRDHVAHVRERLMQQPPAV